MKKRTTKLLFLRRRLPVALMTLALAGAQVAFAQTDNPWVGEQLPANGGEFYLYNKAGGGFLLGGNTWGTQGSLGIPGLVCNLAVSDGKYTIVTNAAGDGRGLGSDGYVDNGTPAAYTFTDPTPDDETFEYVIDLNGTSVLYWGGEGTVLTLDNNGSFSEPQWLLVSRQQREDMLANATRENGVDATFYVVGAGFDRAQPGAWKETHTGGTINLCGPGANANNHHYCAEAYNNDNVDIYQELTGIRNGRYRVSCQGFYRCDTGARNAMLYAGVNEVPLNEGVDDGQGMPNDMNSAANAFAAGRYGGLQVEAVVLDGTLRFGVKKNAHVANDWAIFDNFRLTYLGEATEEEAFADLLGALQNVQQDFQEWGATAVSDELQAIYDENAGSDYATAQEAVMAGIEQANGVRGITSSLYSGINEAQEYMNRVNGGEVTLCDAAKEALQTRLDEGNNVIANTGMADMLNEGELAVANLDTALANAQTWVALSFSLDKVKRLADRVTGLEGTPEYQAVVADLNDAELTYDNMAAHVKALNLKIQEALTPEFLATVTEDTELDLTSFITNPNIYNNLGVQGLNMPDGWICGSVGSRDNHNFCTVASGDGALTCYSWPGDVGNDVTNAHYYQKIGGGETGISLPDGLYRLEALTNTSTEAGKMVMYATPDSVEFDTVGLNRDNDRYEEAVAVQGTTTVLQDVVVNGGMLYIGIKGADPVNNHQGGLGYWWNGDNFRLYYIGADVLAAYRERLRGRLAEVAAMCDSIAKCGIDVEDVTSIVADYEELLDELEEEDVLTGVEEMDYYLDEGEAILANWNRMNPLLVNGKRFVEEMAQEVLFVKPSARAAFEAAVQAADEAASDNAWDNWTTDEMAAAGEALATATAEFKNAVAVFFTIGKAKVLADQIGGLEETGAYQTVMEWLAWDGDIDALELQLAASDLQAECLAAMTPEVLATATVEKPFDMTTFIANPNIFQDAIDADDVPINTVANGWTLQTIADNAARTSATAGDTWLIAQSWSGNGSHNISSATDYRQIVGTQDNVMEEGKYRLPAGAYRVEAATFVVPGNEKSNWYKLQLYAQTNLATPHDTTNIVGGDSIYYTYTEIEVADSSFNDDETVWNAAQNAMGTTTVVPEIYVDNGAVTIGVRGNGIVGGTNSWFGADNFRLYYIGTKRGVNIGDVIADKQDKALSEIVDVYDITGQLVRKQVKRADAVKGLKKGIYVVDGQKFVVSGN